MYHSTKKMTRKIWFCFSKVVIFSFPFFQAFVEEKKYMVCLAALELNFEDIKKHTIVL